MSVFVVVVGVFILYINFFQINFTLTPPSTKMVCPVILRLNSLHAKKTQAFATSSATICFFKMLFSIVAALREWKSFNPLAAGVFTGPLEMQLTRQLGANSNAKYRATDSNAALEGPIVSYPGATRVLPLNDSVSKLEPGTRNMGRNSFASAINEYVLVLIVVKN